MSIKRANDDLRAAIEGAPTALVTVDRHGNITMVSSPLQRLFGYGGRAPDRLQGERAAIARQPATR